MKILIVGGGKVGRALARAIRDTRHSVKLVPARALARPARSDHDIVVLAARDAAIAELATRFAAPGWLSPRAVMLHVAGALGPEVLAPVRRRCAGIGQAHPLLSFADSRRPPSLRGAHLLVSGDPVAERRARALGRAIGMVPRSWPGLDPALYHAAAALAANGAVALVAAAATLLESAGAPSHEVSSALGPLLRSVAVNVEGQGLPAALTGPVRRGDAPTVRRHLALLDADWPDIAELYRACGRQQLVLARALAEARPAELTALARLLRAPQSPPARRRRSRRPG
jgi:predicted short-subunit dehydrogenase-like oxidoreductase (DUF2520 family)